MTREEFIKISTKLGLGLAVMPSLFSSCQKEELTKQFNGKVIIIGAGASGLLAAYTCWQNDIEFEVLEANATFGGRVKIDRDFADFPIDIGAEWIHTDPAIFSRMLKNENAIGEIALTPYELQEIKAYQDGKLTDWSIGQHTYGEFKFSTSTWLEFFENFVVPSIVSSIRYNTIVESVNYGESLEVVTSQGTYSGDKVIVTVPLNILKSNLITFNPGLPADKINAINSTNMPDGIKVFIKFKEKFYPEMLSMGGINEFINDGRLYYDAAFKKDSNENVLALFNVGGNASELTSIEKDIDLIQTILAELDEVFDGKASENYISHIAQNWSNEPFIQGAYSFYGNNANDLIDRISLPVNEQVYFAGEALNKEEWSTVHGAALNGRNLIEDIIYRGI